MAKRHQYNYLKLLLTTSLLFSGTINVVNAANVTATGDAAFNSNTNWLPNAPQDADSIIYGASGLKINANVSNRFINNIDLTNIIPGLLSISESTKIGPITGNNSVLDIKFLNDNKVLELSGRNSFQDQEDYDGVKNIDFNGKANSRIKITAMNLVNPYDFKFDFKSSTTPAGTIELVDYADTVLNGQISNVKNLVINGFTWLTLNSNINLTEDFEVGGGQIMVNNGSNITAKRIRGTSRDLFFVNYFSFRGDSVVDAAIGQEPDNTIAYLLFDVGIPRTVEFKKPVKIFYDFQLYTDTNIKLGGNVAGREIEVLRFAPSQNVVEFNNQASSKANILIGGCWGDTFAAFGTGRCGQNKRLLEEDHKISPLVDGPLRGICPVNILRHSQATVEYYNPVYINNLDFSNPDRTNAAIFLLDDATLGFDLANVNVTTASTKRIHSIHVSIDQHIIGKIASFTNPIATIKTLKDTLIQVNTADFYTDVSTLTKDTGTLEFIKPNSFSYSVGDNNSDLSMKEIKFTESSEIRGSGYAKNITIASGKTAKFLLRKAVNGSNVNPFMETTDKLLLKGTGSKLIIGDGDIVTPTRLNGVEVRGKILTENTGQNEVLFEGNINLRAQIGDYGKRLKNATFAANSMDKVITYARDIHANTINFGKTTINIAAGGVLDGVTTAISPVVNFGQHILIFTGGNSKFLGTPVFNVYFANIAQDESNSHITVTGQSGNLDLAGVDNLTFNITDMSAILPPRSGIIYNFYRREDNGVINVTANNKVTVNNLNNPFVTWQYVNGQLRQTANVEGGIGIITDSERERQRALILLDDLDAETALAYATFLMTTVAAGDVVTAADSLNRILEATNPTSQLVIDTINSYQSTMINNRVGDQVTKDFQVAAGDEIVEDYGVWAQPFFSKGVQKMYKTQSGYHTKAEGGTIGVDANINDKTLLGLAGSYIKNKIRYKDKKSGDKSLIDTFILSLYGMQEICDRWFAESILSVGTSKVKNSKPRFNTNGMDIAKGSYRSTSYGAELSAGYNYQPNANMIITPVLGMKYNRFDSDNYSEKGAVNLNLNVKKKAYNKLEAVFGSKLTMPYMYSTYNLTPQLQAFVSRDLLNKALKAYVSLDGVSSAPMPVRSQKPVRTNYNIGAALAAEAGIAEYELNYNMTLAKKFHANQVAVKVKVRF